MEENKDKRTADNNFDDEELVFRREPARAPKTSPRPVPPQNMQHTAQVKAGAVVRPLKKTTGTPAPRTGVVQSQTPSQRQGTPRTAQGTTGVQRPTAPTGVVPRGSGQPGAANATQKPVSGAQNPQRMPQNLPQQPQRPQTPSLHQPNHSTSLGVQTSRVRRPGNTSTQSIQPQPRRRGENDDFEIDEEMTNSRQMRAVAPDSAFTDSATSAIMSLVKAMVYIVAIIVVSVGIALFAINTANDVFKFVVDEKIVSVEIPEYATIDDVADALHEAGAIKYKWAFKLWSELKDSGAEFIPGTYEVSTSLNYDYLRASFKENKNKFTEVRVTIPEGYTVDEIIDLFVGQGIGTREGFVDAIQNYDFDYPFLENLEVSEDRIYRLEGYLFPDTYYFYKESSEATILSKMLDNFNKKFVEEYYSRCEQLGLTVDEAIILASMIEKETRFADELGAVSSVFHNRLNNPATYPYLNSDATIMYAMHHDLGGRPDTMTGEDTDYDTPYNTYTHKGLPPGPIANPGLNAIKYALYPNKTNYYFFVSDSSGRTLFATTQLEHLANINTVRGN